jgi:hypothetical protein
MQGGKGRGAGAVIAALALLSCAPQPISLTRGYDAPARSSAPRPAQAASACRVHLVAVKDGRGDAQSMGDIGGRPVLEKDSTAWLRSGLESLGDGMRLAFVDENPAQVEMSAELLKAYIQSEAGMAEAANVVVRIRYGSAGSDEVIYRGRQAGVNWTSGTDETQGALDNSLGQILEKVGLDLAERCRAT